MFPFSRLTARISSGSAFQIIASRSITLQFNSISVFTLAAPCKVCLISKDNPINECDLPDLSSVSKDKISWSNSGKSIYFELFFRTSSKRRRDGAIIINVQKRPYETVKHFRSKLINLGCFKAYISWSWRKAGIGFLCLFWAYLVTGGHGKY